MPRKMNRIDHSLPFRFKVLGENPKTGEVLIGQFGARMRRVNGHARFYRIFFAQKTLSEHEKSSWDSEHQRDHVTGKSLIPWDDPDWTFNIEKPIPRVRNR